MEVEAWLVHCNYLDSETLLQEVGSRGVLAIQTLITTEFYSNIDYKLLNIKKLIQRIMQRDNATTGRLRPPENTIPNAENRA